jgi:signal peptidase II
MRRPSVFATLVLLGVVVDHASKFIVFQSLREGEVIVVIKGWLEIMRAENTGVAFSWLRNQQFVILAVVFVALASITWLYLRIWRTAHPVMIWALGLLLVGAIGNLIDRMAFRYVRDFIDFVHPVPLVGRWAVFNFADICITLGVILFVVAELFLKDKPDAASAGIAPPASSDRMRSQP